MKQWILRLIMDTCLWIDRKLGKYKPYSYETAPYCGHHYNGHAGWLTSSRYHEGYGYCCARIGWLEVGKDDEEGYYGRVYSREGIHLWESQRHVAARVYVRYTWSFHGLSTQLWQRNRRTKKWLTITQKMNLDHATSWFGLRLKCTQRIFVL